MSFAYLVYMLAVGIFLVWICMMCLCVSMFVLMVAVGLSRFRAARRFENHNHPGRRAIPRSYPRWYAKTRRSSVLRLPQRIL